LSSWTRAFLATLLAPLGLVLLFPAPVAAQEAAASAAPAPASKQDKVSVDEALAKAREVYGPPAPEPEVPIECAKQRDRTPDEIVVCARLEDSEKYHVRSSLDQGDDSHLSWAGDPPDLEPQYPGDVVARGCFIPPCPPPPTYYFDIEALPEAPPGSDADKIAKGEMPGR